MKRGETVSDEFSYIFHRDMAISEGRVGDADDMIEYLNNSRDYAISAQTIQKNRYIKIAIHHLKKAINHANFNNFSEATKDAGLYLTHIK